MGKKIAILGSTGSIGNNALRVIDALGDGYEVYALSANSSVEELANQCRAYKPKVAAVTDGEFFENFLSRSDGLDVKVLEGGDGMIEIARDDNVDVVITAVVGSAGLPAVLAAAEAGKTIAIANKEPLVAAGKLLMETAKANGAEILPVDSEHSAVFQAMQSGRINEVKRIMLTASGGPFRGASAEDIRNVTVEQALSHPTWEMGPKITIDSATMMNKALEVIEAKWLFGIDIDMIEVVIHPQSIVHSMVEFVDGSVIAQMGSPDMCLPIQYALTYPERVEGIGQSMSFDQMRRLDFELPDMEVFRLLRIGYEVGKAGGTGPAVFNAANEAAVEKFLSGRISFTDIFDIVERCVESHDFVNDPGLFEIMEADKHARAEVVRIFEDRVNKTGKIENTA